MKITIEFDYDDDWDAVRVKQMLSAPTLISNLIDYQNWLRTQVKHGDHLEKVIAAYEDCQREFLGYFGHIED